MYRARARACPACASPMREVTFAPPAQEPTKVDLCDGCGGVFLEFFDGEPTAIARGLARSLEASLAASATSSVRTCPDCAIPMEARPFLGDGPPVDRCGTCLALFSSAAQLQELATYASEPAEPPPERSWIERALRALGLR